MQTNKTQETEPTRMSLTQHNQEQAQQESPHPDSGSSTSSPEKSEATKPTEAADATPVTDTTKAADATDVTDVTDATDVTDVTDATEAADATDVTDATPVTDVSSRTKPTEVSDATDAIEEKVAQEAEESEKEAQLSTSAVEEETQPDTEKQLTADVEEEVEKVAGLGAEPSAVEAAPLSFAETMQKASGDRKDQPPENTRHTGGFGSFGGGYRDQPRREQGLPTHPSVQSTQETPGDETPQEPQIGEPRSRPPRKIEAKGLFGVVELLLKDRTQLYTRIKTQQELTTLIPGLLYIILFCTVPVGAILGSYNGGWQILYASLKIPLLLLLTLAICFCAFWAWSLYFRSSMQSSQVAALSLSSIAVTSLILLGLSPFLWLLLGGGALTYHHAATGLFVTFAIGGAGGVSVLHRGLQTLFIQTPKSRPGGRKTLAAIWIGLYGLVGLQMAWLLRPYLFHPWANGRPLTFIRSLEGNVYESLIRTLLTVLGLQ